MAKPDPQGLGWNGDTAPVAQLSPEQRRDRAERIRDAAASVGMTNGVLLAGIGQAETSLAHCWSEATWACQGPASSTCDGGPVIAGAADGPCSAQQGGLGMFQFDSGTYAQTIATYGEDVVTIEGNVGAVVPFLVTRAIQSVNGVNNEQEALAWMNSIPVVDGDPLYEEWLYFVAWRYNGCMGCTSVQKKYRDGTRMLWDEFGADFWGSPSPLEDDCDAVPSSGRVIEETDECYKEGGRAEFWLSSDTGHQGGLRYTKTTAADAVDNYGIWNLKFDKAGRYELEVFVDGGEFGQSKQATYLIVHDGETISKTIDQSSKDGFVSLGVFEFAKGGEQNVRLNDNTGEPYADDPGGTRLMFDAIKVIPEGQAQDDDDVEPVDPEVGGCSTTTSGGTWLGLCILGLLAHRKRRC